MYNRYVPQSDGSYCRTRIPDSPPRQPAVSQPRKNIPASSECEEPAVPNIKPVSPPRPKPSGCGRNNQRNHPQPNQSCGSVGSFLKQILPKNFETADLIVVLLLLLISADNAEDQNNALLTLALYLFM